ncbi:MAG: Asp-tRNA(Asn)/Glu-tRNA(Gln) amidotransferase subunit GatC [Patescibacteria group bacterium]
MSLSKEDVLHIAKLARLELTEAEVVKFRKQLSSILEYVDVLQKAEGGEGREIKQIHDLENVARADEMMPFPEEDRKAMLKQAPGREGDYVKTSGVFES